MRVLADKQFYFNASFTVQEKVWPDQRLQLTSFDQLLYNWWTKWDMLDVYMILYCFIMCMFMLVWLQCTPHAMSSVSAVSWCDFCDLSDICANAVAILTVSEALLSECWSSCSPEMLQLHQTNAKTHWGMQMVSDLFAHHDSFTGRQWDLNLDEADGSGRHEVKINNTNIEAQANTSDAVGTFWGLSWLVAKILSVITGVLDHNWMQNIALTLIDCIKITLNY